MLSYTACLILDFVRNLPLEERKRFASHRSKGISRKDLSENNAIIYAAMKMQIFDIPNFQRSPHRPKQSALSFSIRGGA